MTLQNNNNYIYEICFNIVYNDWMENNNQSFELIFIEAYQYGYNDSEEKQLFMYDVAEKIYEKDPFNDEVDGKIIEEMVNKMKYEIYFNLYYPYRPRPVEPPKKTTDYYEDEEEDDFDITTHEFYNPFFDSDDEEEPENNEEMEVEPEFEEIFPCTDII